MALTLAPPSLEMSCRPASSSAEPEQDRRRERLFEKVVTPSDVGKLNRLVVPKHFAEKHLPLPGAAARAGTVLCFHDARGGGGTWRFRYSYWGSSQSYVMTKGWSRYVRDKRLAAGDTVSFCRDGARLYIDCRRRGNKRLAAAAAAPFVPAQAAAAAFFFKGLGAAGIGGGKNTTSSNNREVQQQQQELVVVDEDDVARRRRAAGPTRLLRLFGVDMELRAAEPLLLDLQL
ncbi:hypothetical protein QOZ80_6BG0457990 [Eleusine coracana subsp. coracana]|nr:hypothetical protein QOZ80_6BG0457990 [Eleusine coracana subsp. coracana]